jgi:hypothetical protein
MPVLTRQINQDLICLERWCNENGMVINTSKTKPMLIAGKRIPNNTSTFSISIDAKLNDAVIEQVRSYKLLGVSLDQDLMFTTQIDELCKKLSKRVGLLRHICPYLKQKQREIYYSAIIKPGLLYGSTVWCSCKQDDLQRVLKLQKRAARVILDADRRACSVDLFNTLGWLPFYIEVHINRCTLV